MGKKAEFTRNFCIIAHIDHGKSTLADRFLELTGTISNREKKDQILDSMDLERERGITIKAAPVAMKYTSADGRHFRYNLIDTPGHVDFSYEVSRSLAACEGALLVVDATKGIQAQTLANAYLAVDHDLTIIPVINKIDLPASQVEKVQSEILNLLGGKMEDIHLVSAKDGTGVPELLEYIVKEVPPPEGEDEAPLRALIFDSFFNAYVGVVVYIRVREGTVKAGDTIRMMATGYRFDVDEVGILTPAAVKVEVLKAGDVGYVVAGIKDLHQSKVGDTITHHHRPAEKALEGFQALKPMVFAGLYPTDASQYNFLRDALEKLVLNDASLHFIPENSAALGFGFRCGFLGLLHMEIVQERLEREFDLDLVITAPNVIYRVHMGSGEMLELENPSKFPDPTKIDHIEEPFVKATVLVPQEYVGAVMKLNEEKRGIQKNLQYLDMDRVLLEYELPLNEIIMDYYDKLKSGTRGYASLDYEFFEFRTSNLVKMDILINGEAVDALSCILHRDNAAIRGRSILVRLRKAIHRQMFEVALQAAIGGKIIARESISALRKNVIAKCYGGDITRKRKLLEKQKEGKKRMKRVGTVDVPQEAFMSILRIDDES